MQCARAVDPPVSRTVCHSTSEFTKLSLTIHPDNTFHIWTPFAMSIRVVSYSDKAIAVLGDSRAIKDELKALGGKWNGRLTVDGAPAMGWIFRTGLLASVKACIAAHAGPGAKPEPQPSSASSTAAVPALEAGGLRPPAAKAEAVDLAGDSASLPSAPDLPLLSMTADGRLRVGGGAFSFRFKGRLRALGGAWDAENAAWMLPTEARTEVEALAAGWRLPSSASAASGIASPLGEASCPAAAGRKRSHQESLAESLPAAASNAVGAPAGRFRFLDRDSDAGVYFSEGVGTGGSSADELSQPTACEDCGAPTPRAGLSYCNLRFRTDSGPAMRAKDVLSERLKLAGDEASARYFDSPSRGHLTQTLYSDVLAKQRVRRVRDAARNIDHCSVVVCGRCLVAPRHCCRSATAVSASAAAETPSGAEDPEPPLPRLALPASRIGWTATSFNEDGAANGGMSTQERWAVLLRTCVLAGAPTADELLHPKGEDTACVCDASEQLCCFRRGRAGRGKAAAATSSTADEPLVYKQRGDSGSSVPIRAARIRQDPDDPTGSRDRIQFVDTGEDGRHPTVWPHEVSLLFLRRLTLEQWEGILRRSWLSGDSSADDLHTYVRRDTFAVRAAPPAGRRSDWTCDGGGGFALLRDAPPGRAYLRVGGQDVSTLTALGAQLDEARAERPFISTGTPVAPFARFLPDYFDWDVLDRSAAAPPPPPSLEPEYRCIAVLQFATSGRNGDQCAISKGLDEFGFCPFHGNRRDSKWNWRMLDAAVPRYRPPQDDFVESVADEEKEKKKKAAAGSKTARAEEFRASVQALLPSPSCDGATQSALFHALAASFLSAPSSVRKRSHDEVASALRRAWEAIAAAGVDQVVPAEDAPLGLVHRSPAPQASVSMTTATLDVFVSALHEPPLVTRLRVTSEDAWRDYFSSLCQQRLPAGIAPSDVRHARARHEAWHALGGPNELLRSLSREVLPNRFPSVHLPTYTDDAFARATVNQPAPETAELAMAHARAALCVEKLRVAIAAAAERVFAAVVSADTTCADPAKCVVTGCEAGLYEPGALKEALA